MKQIPAPKNLIIAGIILVVLVVGFMFLRRNPHASQIEDGQDVPVPGLAYCNDEKVEPCVVSFSIDADNRMLVNFLLPDLSFPTFYLRIVRGEKISDYNCQRTSTDLNLAYCIGERMPPGETLRLMLFSTNDDILLAQGDLSIIGIAFPEPDIAIPTPSVTTTYTPTETAPPVQTPSSTPIPTTTPIPSYP